MTRTVRCVNTLHKDPSSKLFIAERKEEMLRELQEGLIEDTTLWYIEDTEIFNTITLKCAIIPLREYNKLLREAGKYGHV